MAAETSITQQRKKVVREFFGLIMQGRQIEGLRLFSPDCVQHNPYTHGGMKELFDAMSEAQSNMNYPDPVFKIRRVLADGNMVVVHTEMLVSKSKPGEGGLRQAHIFRFGRGNKIVEYWDISQFVDKDKPNAAGAFN